MTYRRRSYRWKIMFWKSRLTDSPTVHPQVDDFNRTLIILIPVPLLVNLVKSLCRVLDQSSSQGFIGDLDGEFVRLPLISQVKKSCEQLIIYFHAFFSEQALTLLLHHPEFTGQM